MDIEKLFTPPHFDHFKTTGIVRNYVSHRKSVKKAFFPYNLPPGGLIIIWSLHVFAFIFYILKLADKLWCWSVSCTKLVQLGYDSCSIVIPEDHKGVKSVALHQHKSGISRERLFTFRWTSYKPGSSSRIGLK